MALREYRGQNRAGLRAGGYQAVGQRTSRARARRTGKRHFRGSRKHRVLVGLSKPLGWARQRESETKETAHSRGNNPWLLAIAGRYCAPTRLFEAGCDIGHTWARLSQTGWDAQQIWPERETAANKSARGIQSQYGYHASRGWLRSGDGRDSAQCEAGRC